MVWPGAIDVNSSHPGTRSNGLSQARTQLLYPPLLMSSQVSLSGSLMDTDAGDTPLKVFVLLRCDGKEGD